MLSKIVLLFIGLITVQSQAVFDVDIVQKDQLKEGKKDFLSLRLDIDMEALMLDQANNVFNIGIKLMSALWDDFRFGPKPLPADAKLYPREQIKSHGFKFETHNVETEDGYINTIWHVWNPNCTHENLTSRLPVFFQHGLIDIGGTWFFNEQNKSGAYILARECRDIWVGNNRGTANSYLHTKYTVKDKQYWDYSFHEMGLYDLPANINFVLNKTNATQVVYVGHSQGTEQFWISNILREDIGPKIKAMAAFAPVMSIAHQNSPAVALSFKLKLDVLLVKYLDHFLVLRQGSSILNDLILDIAPRFIELLPRTVWMFVQTIVGIDSESHMNPARMPMMAKNDVGGTGTINLSHWIQLAKTKRFAPLQRGSQPEKDYDVAKMKTTLANTDMILFVGENDALSQLADVKFLTDNLPAGKFEQINVSDYNHLDYMWAQDSDEKLLKPFLDFVSKH